MQLNTTAIIAIVIIAALIGYLIYSNNKNKNTPSIDYRLFSPPTDSKPCEHCEYYKSQLSQQPISFPSQQIHVDMDPDPYSDPIKKQDIYGMQDYLTYPQMRLPRDVLEKYKEYYEKHGSYPFGQPTQPLFDNPVLNGMLIRQFDENDPFADQVNMMFPLFRVKSNKNNNRFFYYIVERGNLSKLELKIPLDNIKINGNKHANSDFNGLPELYDGDIIENIPAYPHHKYKVLIYKTYHFPFTNSIQ